MENTIKSTIDHLFRSEYAKLISYLTSKFGTSRIDRIEDTVQESLLKAMRVWSFNEIPTNPSKWLYRVSYNNMLDIIRRENKTVLFNPEIMNDHLEGDFEFDQGIQDDQLKMIFACCHPTIKENDQIMLSLKLLCGFSNKEIGRALLKNPDTIKKALTRAKEKFRTEVKDLSIPSESELPSRLYCVLQVIYLLFTNGYTAYDGNKLLKKDVCEDALRLAGLLYVNQQCNTPELRALISLMSYNLSRFEARASEEGDLIPMIDQDRKLWNTELIHLGNRFMTESQDGSNYSRYHLEAAIAHKYAISSSYESINWDAILKIYTLLVKQTESATLALNRLVVLAKVKGDKLALEELYKLQDRALLSNHHYYSIKGEFEKNLSMSSYRKSISKAIELTNNEKEKKFLQQKLNN